MTDVKQEGVTDAAVRTVPGGVRPVDAATPPTARPAVPRVDGKDPRYLALRNFAMSMSIFNIIGYTLLGFEQPWTWPFFALLVGYTAEIGIEMVSAWAGKRRPAFSGNGVWGMYTFLLPTHITALAANMLLYANDRFWPVAFAVVVAIGAKTALRAPVNGRMRHFMNPSNFGITVTLLAFSWVNIAPPYQFTENVPDAISIMVPLVIITAGTVLNAMLTRKVLLIVGWLGGFVIQAVVRALVLDVAIWAALVPMTGVAFVLFTNYMITDPGTTPSRGRNQFMFGSAVAGVYGVLVAFNVVYTLFFAVTIVCAVRGLMWWGIWWRDRSRERARGSVPVSPAAPALVR
ncbi:enediyne biosynthesis protein [Micromonospora antibiotica]|uniref:Enediyne biosynthesis protein n=2 Tax=Micromonospora TaxID=1873 RepID=A0ABS3V5V3_9ACTN|nr:enediyne biosynthesis protein [Micromonospora antibiotica]